MRNASIAGIIRKYRTTLPPLLRAVLSEFCLLSVVLYLLVVVAVEIQGANRPWISWQILKLATLIAGFFVAVRLANQSIPGIIFVERVVRCFQLESFGDRGRGFRRSVGLAGEFSALVACIDDLLRKHHVASRTVTNDHAEWILKLGGYRFRAMASKGDVGKASIAVEPLSRWIRFYLVPAEGLGATAIAGILWRALQGGAVTFALDSNQAPKIVNQDLAQFYNPRWYG